MVKKMDKAPLPDSAKRIALSMRGLMAERGVTQARVALILGRSPAYVSERFGGLEAWNFAELDMVSEALGFGSVFDLLDEVSHRAGRRRSLSDHDGPDRETWLNADPAE